MAMTLPYRARFLALDSWRGIAAIMIVLHHCEAVGFVAGSAFIENASVFVALFFVLSGFVIASAYHAKLAAGFSISRYMALRIGRLLPVHGTVLILYVTLLTAIAIATRQETLLFTAEGLAEFLRTLLYIQIFAYPAIGIFNPPSWSVAAEFWVYGIAAILAGWLKGRVFVAMVIAAAIAFGVLLANMSEPAPLFEPGLPMFAALYGFALGYVCWKVAGSPLTPEGKSPSALFTTAELITVGGMGIGIAFGGTVLLTLVFPPLFAIAIWLFSLERGEVSRWLKSPLFIRLGDLSYAIYVSHMLVLMVVGTVWTKLDAPEIVPLTSLAEDLYTIANVVLAIVFAAGLHAWIERPARVWSRRILLPDREAKHAEAIAPTF